MSHIDKKYYFALVLLTIISIIFSLLIFPDWFQSYWWIFLLPITAFVGVVTFLANFRTAFPHSFNGAEFINPTYIKEFSQPFNVPDLPKPYYLRLEDVNSIKSMILINKNVDEHGPCKIGIQGMGGVGKTVLAKAVAHDQEIRNIFHDGIIWLSIGQASTNARKRQEDIAFLFGEKINFRDTDQGKIYLRELLEKKSCLIILDDVWKKEDAEAFDCLNKDSALFITSRSKRIIYDLQMQPYQVNVLHSDAAQDFLCRWVGIEKEGLPDEAVTISEQCGYLPLALAMSGAYIKKYPDSWGKILHRLQNADLEKLERMFPDYDYPNLLKALQVSIDLLSTEDREILTSLAIFPEEESISKQPLILFWNSYGLDSEGVEDKLISFADLSILEYVGDVVYIHDLMRDYLNILFNEQLPELNLRFLQSYKIFTRE